MIKLPQPSTTGCCHQFAPLPPTMSSTKLPSRTEAVLSRRQVEGLIADGRSIIIVDQRVLKVDPWLKYHPGGAKAIMHMVGRDATDEVNGYVLFVEVRVSPVSLMVLAQISLARSQETHGEISNWPNRRAMGKLCATNTRWKIQIIRRGSHSGGGGRRY